MKSLARAVKRFLAAEEVPRWFGLSIVLIYLVGLGSVAHYGIVEAKREETAYFRQGSRYAVRLLAQRLSLLTQNGLADPARDRMYQRSLRAFSANIPARSLRIVDGGNRILASTQPTEIGTHPAPTGALARARSAPEPFQILPLPAAGQSAPDTFIRARLPLLSPATLTLNDPLQGGGIALDNATLEKNTSDSGSPVRSGKRTSPLFLEVTLPPEPFGISSLADQARTLSIVLAVLGALFVVYRCLREQLRSVARIADRLQLHGHRLEEELNSLRIESSSQRIDEVTSAWNSLIDLTQELQQTVQRSEANRELSNALQRSGGAALAEALSAIPDGLMYITDEIRLDFVNASACRLLGWDPQNVKERILTEIESTGVGAKILDLVREAQQPNGSYEARMTLLDVELGGDMSPPCKGIDRSSYRVRIIPLQRLHKDGECVVLIRDVSQQVRADRAREEFITQVTHELRTPLTNIRAYTETLSSGMFDDPSVITECYNVITKETRRLSRLIEDMLNVSQLEVGSIELQIDHVDLKTLLGEGIRDVRGLADEKDIDLQLVLPAKLESIRADRDKLAVVVNNLLANAIKYTPENGNVLVGCQFTTDELVITVKDNGIGIAPADQKRIFEKFQRSDDQQVQAESGTGIGLFTAREIMRRHHGEIELISEKGQGSTFLVHLPHKPPRDRSTSGLGDRMERDGDTAPLQGGGADAGDTIPLRGDAAPLQGVQPPKKTVEVEQRAQDSYCRR